MTKLAQLSAASALEAGEAGCRKGNTRRDGIILTHAVMPNGRKTTLLKSLLTSVCENDCLYCPMRAGRDVRRISFQPEEFAQMAVNLSRAGLIQGVFLSSGVAGGGIRTQDQLIDTAMILRRKMGYQGYIHLKVMPGTEFDQVLESMRLSDRVSINLEAPNAQRLPALAPDKDFEGDLMAPIRMINRIRSEFSPAGAWKNRWPSACTQFVVGGADESDRELLQSSQLLHRQHNLLRVYFSALTPHPGTPLAGHAPIPKQRELRLYQADYLIRDYGFEQDEIETDTNGLLPLELDPKKLWAERNLRNKPVEINTAGKRALLRVPGIGLKSAQAIISARRIQTLRDVSALRKIGIHADRAIPYILLNGHQPIRQMRFSFSI